jgi:hypothetical protein
MNGLGYKLRVLFSFNIVVLLVGLPFLGIGLYEAYKSGRALQTYGRIEGTITGNSYIIDPEDNSGAYYPNVTFQPEDSRPVRFTDGVGTYPARYNVGDKVAVLYNPSDPSDARINSWFRLWTAPIILTIVGAAPLLVNLLINYFILNDMLQAKRAADAKRF